MSVGRYLIPNYQAMMLPILTVCADEEQHRIRDVYYAVADILKLSQEEREQLLPSGNARVLHNRVQWAKLGLVRAGLLCSPSRGVIEITPRGRDFVASKPERVDDKTLQQFPEFVEFKNAITARAAGRTSRDELQEEPSDSTHVEAMEDAHQSLREALTEELLEQVKSASPSFFERLVVDLLVSMGYGGANEGAGRVVGRSSDGGIDGIIKEDRLGLDVVYVQAKRWENVVGRPEIQKFAGAIQGQRSRKGVFITTSSFTRDAEEYASSIESRIVLIDGSRLAQLMIDFDIGVSPVNTYVTKRIDSDYFTEE
ncbi:MAG: restriction endonuclease [Planctomycetes bacterium]|nr:restriction endonuclease [Planctomycetota bacterium]